MGDRAKPLLIHFAAIAGLALISLLYFYPVLNGKAIVQSDIQQYKGMSRERDAFKEDTGKESYWTNSAFGGMPTYQLGANYPHHYVKKLDRLIRFLPRPADYLFLYFLSFYILMLAMGVRWPWAFCGALAFGLSTYYLIIIDVGHNAKAHAIGYMPLVLAGLLLVLRKKWIWGGLLTTIALALEIGANHYQMTYYLGFCVGLLLIFKAVEWVRQGRWRLLIPLSLTLTASLILALAMNAASLLATAEYTSWSTRGAAEWVENSPGGGEQRSSGLDYEYITQYSYGPFESLNLLVPGLTGGSNAENLGDESHTYAFLRKLGADRMQALEFSRNLPLYWGEQPIVAAPAYIGAVVIFCFLLGVFLLRNAFKWWLLSTAALGLLLSWGSHVEGLTRFLIDFLPLYDKFRAVSSLQVITELSVSTLAVLGVYEYSKQPGSRRSQRALYLAGGIAIGVLILLLVAKGSLSFQSASDALYEQYYGKDFVSSLIKDRKELYQNDVLRSMLLVICVGIWFWMYRRFQWKPGLLLAGWTLLVVFDLWGVGRRYVNSDSFDSPVRMERPFRMTAADKEIRQDTGHFRVFDIEESLNGARTSYFHKSIGGYHAAKPRSIQLLFEYQLEQGNLVPLHMLNVKYILQRDEEGTPTATINTGAYGNAWFVDRTREVKDQREALLGLDSLTADSVALWARSGDSVLDTRSYAQMEKASIDLKGYAPDRLTYRTSSAEPGFAVFSELWYPHGWKATIDGKEVPIYRVNYCFRGLEIPEGEHEIVFSFEPPVVRRGSTIGLWSTLILITILGFAGFREFRERAQG